MQMPRHGPCDGRRDDEGAEATRGRIRERVLLRVKKNELDGTQLNLELGPCIATLAGVRLLENCLGGPRRHCATLLCFAAAYCAESGSGLSQAVVHQHRFNGSAPASWCQSAARRFSSVTAEHRLV